MVMNVAGERLRLRTGDTPTNPTRRLFQLVPLLACLGVLTARADDVLLDPRFEGLSAPKPTWVLSDASRVEADGGVLTIRAGGGFVLASQDLDVRGLTQGRIVEWSCDAELLRLATGRGAWISLQFSDAHERRLGTRTSAILAVPHMPERLSTRTAIPDGTRRASAVLVVHGDAEARFHTPELRISEAPPAPRWTRQEPVPITEGPSVPGAWLGFGLSVDGVGMAAGRVQSAAPRVLRALVPWESLSVSGAPAAEAVEPIVTAVSKMAAGERHVILAPTGGDSGRYADPLRAAAALHFLAVAVMQELGGRGASEGTRWYVSPAMRPDALQHLDLPHYLECVQELAAILPEGVALAGPFESAGTLWTRLMREAFLARGGLLTAEVTIARRDLALAPAELEERARAGVVLCVLDVTTDHPDAAPYLGSVRNHLDALVLLLESARAGLRIPVLTHSLAPPASAIVPLFRAARAGPVASALVVPDGAALVGLVVREPVGNRVAVMLANPGQEALSVEFDIDFGGSERRLRRTQLLESAGLAATESEVAVRDGKLVDMVPSSALVIYESDLRDPPVVTPGSRS